MDIKKILIFLILTLVITCSIVIKKNIDLTQKLNNTEDKVIVLVEENKNLTSIFEEKISNMEASGVPTYFTEEEVEYVAKTVYGEARGCSKIQQSAIVWCILNRLENGHWGDTIKDVVTAKGQFNGYSKNLPVTEEIKTVVEDVLYRWNMEKNGIANIGRTLPKRFIYFHSNGLGENCFTTNAGSGEKWDFNCWNPYD